MYEMEIFSLDYLCCKQYGSKCLVYSVLLCCFECQSMVSMSYGNSTFFLRRRVQPLRTVVLMFSGKIQTNKSAIGRGVNEWLVYGELHAHCTWRHPVVLSYKQHFVKSGRSTVSRQFFSTLLNFFSFTRGNQNVSS